MRVHEFIQNTRHLIKTRDSFTPEHMRKALFILDRYQEALEEIRNNGYDCGEHCECDDRFCESCRVRVVLNMNVEKKNEMYKETI